MDKSVRIASNEEFCAINAQEKLFHHNCGFALQWIYAQQKWRGKHIAERILGMSASTWDQYAQPSYPKKRSLHAVACFSWLSQVSMTALYLGTKIEQHWPGANTDSIRAIVYSGMLPKQQFSSLVDVFVDQLSIQGTNIKGEIAELMAKLNEHNDKSFLMPERIDLDEFKLDYYGSVAIKLHEFRSNYGISLEEISHVLGVTVPKYLSYENPDLSTTIPLHLGMRLKFGFNLKDTTQLLGEMKVFPGFHRARQIQQLREDVIFSLFKHLSRNESPAFLSLAQQFMVFHTKLSR